jgi:phosphinothricin acetyltransferase
MPSPIRPAAPRDADGILAIYAPIVRATAISFEGEPPTPQQMAQRIGSTLEHLPWLVYERQGDILGYVYASQHRARLAYQWSVDVSVYIQAQARRLGVGRALYTSLFKLLTLQGFYNCYAGITLPNPGSIGLHEALGFQPVGIYRRVGYKLGAWHDVGWWYLALRPATDAPEPPIPWPALMRQSTVAWQQALDTGLPHL